jgi:hypothetical protein
MSKETIINISTRQNAYLLTRLKTDTKELSVIEKNVSESRKLEHCTKQQKLKINKIKFE